MGTLVSAKAISSIREVWWDIRPHPDFGTIEFRICDGLPTMSEVAAVAAMSQCLGCKSELQHTRAIIEHGPSYLRQRDVVASEGTLVDVVDSLIEELRTDR